MTSSIRTNTRKKAMNQVQSGTSLAVITSPTRFLIHKLSISLTASADSFMNPIRTCRLRSDMVTRQVWGRKQLREGNRGNILMKNGRMTKKSLVLSTLTWTEVKPHKSFKASCRTSWTLPTRLLAKTEVEEEGLSVISKTKEWVNNSLKSTCWAHSCSKQLAVLVRAQLLQVNNSNRHLRPYPHLCQYPTRRTLVPQLLLRQRQLTQLGKHNHSKCRVNLSQL